MNQIIITPVDSNEFLLIKELLSKMKIKYSTEKRLNSNSDSEMDWEDISKEGLSFAYSDEEPEYTSDMIKETNPEYLSTNKE